MKTIGAKELRLHLDQVLDRVLAGEDIIVNHRFKGPIRLSALNGKSTNKTNKLAGLHAYEAATKQPSPFDKDKTIKELYHESLAAKYTK